VLVDKPTGPTSHDVVDVVRHVYGTRRTGHAGTLDPFASGLLIVLVGRATRLSRYLVGLPKRYTGSIALGVETDTADHTGAVIGTDDNWRSLSDAAVMNAMGALTGRSLQHPPAHSARKLDGERAYRRARRGELVELEPRPPLRPPREAVEHLPSLQLDAEHRDHVAHGRPVPAADVADDPIALVAGEELVAIAERQGDVLKPRVVLEG
jgi:tRNA U55 pseudouridine synthase TruB